MDAVKHEWVDNREGIDQLTKEEQRRCVNCGAVQTLEREYWYMRVVSRRWMPLVGRCKKVETGE